jgi:hypothetical protein
MQILHECYREDEEESQDANTKSHGQTEDAEEN